MSYRRQRLVAAPYPGSSSSLIQPGWVAVAICHCHGGVAVAVAMGVGAGWRGGDMVETRWR
jgi:hypothetical protein